VIRNPRKFIKQTVAFQAAASASDNSGSIDAKGFRLARISPLVQVNADTASCTLTLEDSADNSSWAAVANTPSIAIAGTDDNTAKAPVDIQLTTLRRYFRIVRSYAGSGTVITPVVIQLLDPIDTALCTDTVTEFGFG